MNIDVKDSRNWRFEINQVMKFIGIAILSFTFFIQIHLVQGQDNATPTSVVDDSPIVFDYDIIINPNEIVIIFEGSEPIDLSEFGFEFKIDNERHREYLKDYIADFGSGILLSPPTCIRLYYDEPESPPNRCPDFDYDIDISNDENEFFWYDIVTDEFNTFLILHDTTQLAYCPARQNCGGTYDSGLTTPSIHNGDVDIILDRGSDNLVLQIEDAGVISLDGFGLALATDAADIHFLQDYATFSSLRFDEIITPICFRLLVEDEQSVLPENCDSSNTLTHIVQRSDVFWYSRGNRTTLRWYERTGIRDWCTQGQIQCLIPWLSSP